MYTQLFALHCTEMHKLENRTENVGHFVSHLNRSYIVCFFFAEVFATLQVIKKTVTIKKGSSNEFQLIL